MAAELLVMKKISLLAVDTFSADLGVPKGENNASTSSSTWK